VRERCVASSLAADPFAEVSDVGKSLTAWRENITLALQS
jgi:hypothetical protein